MAHVPVYHFLTERSILQETPQLSMKNDVYWGVLGCGFLDHDLVNFCNRDFFFREISSETTP